MAQLSAGCTSDMLVENALYAAFSSDVEARKGTRGTPPQQSQRRRVPLDAQLQGLFHLQRCQRVTAGSTADRSLQQGLACWVEA